MPSKHDPVDFPGTTQILRDADGELHVILIPHGVERASLKLSPRQRSHTDKTLAKILFAQQVQRADLSSLHAAATASTRGDERWVSIRRIVSFNGRVLALTITVASNDSSELTMEHSYREATALEVSSERVSLLTSWSNLEQTLAEAAQRTAGVLVSQIGEWAGKILVSARPETPGTELIAARKLDLGDQVLVPAGTACLRADTQRSFILAEDLTCQVFDLMVGEAGHGITYQGDQARFIVWYSMHAEVMKLVATGSAQDGPHALKGTHITERGIGGDIEQHGLLRRQSPVDSNRYGGQLQRMQDPFARPRRKEKRHRLND